jgi:hypothetical protein
MVFFPILLLHVHEIMKSCSLKSHDLIIYALLILILGFLCGSFKFVPQTSIVLPSLLHIVFHFFHSSTLLIIFHKNHDFQAFLSTVLIQSLISSMYLIKMVDNFLLRSNQSKLDRFVKCYVNFSLSTSGEICQKFI